MTVRHVIFDWNGTLIDDCALAVETVNILRQERAMPAITREQYRRAFRFPIRDFYGSLGFELDDRAFAALMARYLELFDARVDACPLHAGVRETIARLRAGAVGVHILSASHHATLVNSLDARGLTGEFDEVAGLGDQLATTKRQLGAELARRLGAPPPSVLYVGDTDHDHEVASAQGWKFLFVSHGHQAAACEAPGVHTITALEQLLEHVGT